MRAWSAGQDRGSVVLYVDRSGSMQGFLDPDYPTRVRTDYRSVIDGLVVGLGPARAYGFGSGIRETEASLGVLGDRAFYSDNDTRLEDALALVARDTALSATHVIVGDGRRGNPNTANDQYVRIRRLAEGWVGGGGTFLAAASLAPFKPVENDPAGCRSTADSAAVRQTCPLYAFVFVAPGAETRIAAALAGRFEHVFAWPLPAVPPGGLTLVPARSHADLTVERGWQRAADGTPIVRVRGAKASNLPLAAALVLRDTTSPAGRAAAAGLRGQRIRTGISVRPLGGSGSEWAPSPAQGSLVRPAGGDTLAVEFLTRGSDGPKYLYRIDLLPSGTPSWLERFDAEDARDAVRTYGLGRLFELFRTRAEQPGVAAAGRIYVAIN